MNKYFKHFKTITAHKYYVMKACFKCGIPIQGILHDLSKYSFTEFASSARYFQGDKSPIEVEKAEAGYSLAWQSHKAKNKHHWQYWTDFEKSELLTALMPPKYVVEMLCDWIGAGKAYNKEKWTIQSFKDWYSSHRERIYVHPFTRGYIEMVVSICETETDLYEVISIPMVKKYYQALKEIYTGKIPRYPIHKSIITTCAA